jgi:hypothetical protein
MKLLLFDLAPGLSPFSSMKLALAAARRVLAV